MGRDNNGKVVTTNESNIAGSLKGMYNFLVGVSAVIPVLFLLRLMYVDVMNADGTVATHTQYYLWNSPLFVGKVFKKTADGSFFTLATLIPLGIIVSSFINCIISVMKAFTEKISWKHAEACNRAYTTTIFATLATLLIFNIVNPFFNTGSGFASQDLHFNITIYIILGISIIGKIVAYYYFKQVKKEHLF
jgi:hypothetical protein